MCCCTSLEVQNYWARIGAPIIDRTDIRIRLGINIGQTADKAKREQQASLELPIFTLADDLPGMRACVQEVANQVKPANASLRGIQVEEHCRLTEGAQLVFRDLIQQKGMLGRSRHSVLRLAKTIADLCGYNLIDLPVLQASLQLRSAISPVEGLSLFQ